MAKKEKGSIYSIKNFYFQCVNGNFLAIEKNPIAPGFILKNTNEVLGCMVYTPLSPGWKQMINAYIKHSLGGYCGEKSPEIAKKLFAIRDSEEINTFYSQLKCTKKDIESLSSIRRDYDYRVLESCGYGEPY